MVEASLSSTGRLALRNTLAGVTTSTGVTPSAGVWHELQVHLRTGVGGTLETWLDGNRVSAISDTFGGFPLIRAQLGDNTAGTAYDLAFDDVALGTQKIP